MGAAGQRDFQNAVCYPTQSRDIFLMYWTNIKLGTHNHSQSPLFLCLQRLRNIADQSPNPIMLPLWLVRQQQQAFPRLLNHRCVLRIPSDNLLVKPIWI
jgi:hypothetical protein